ncbi:MAG TPA: S8 family peptidase [Bacteroidia bacterium]|nr:S8 family peptidase [Bacteroidia bacterium]
MKKVLTLFAVALSVALSAQMNGVNQKAPENWFNLSYSTDHVHGIGTDRTYADLIQGKKPDTVIVAVIDGGVDYTHEDLKDVMWHNPGEIPDNGIDDDHNGYVDDVYGWNFIGGKDGKDVQYDNLELTRLLRPLDKKFNGRDAASIQPAEKDEYNRYLKLKADFDKRRADSQKTFDQISNFKRKMDGMKHEIKDQRKVDSVTYADYKAYTPSDQYKRLAMVLNLVCKNEDDWNNFNTEINEGYDELDAMLKYNLNLDYDPRSIVGDNYDDQTEKYYGNNDVKGPDALHGTHVAGIIAANRGNNLGIKGVNSAVKIMAVRVVPNGDERDKDVANGIRYAVDNGAKIINMSFGKGYSFNKKVVDDAVKYAESKGVLLVHAAGNDSKNNDNTDNFPNDHYLDGGTASNWIEVGALSWKDGKEAVAPFSNFGAAQVNVFAPGVDIKSCKSNGGYIDESGTSMASPVTAGACALIKCYFPSLTPQQIKTIIEQSSDKSLAKKRVIKPGYKKKKVKFKKLSTSGGVVDVYAAFRMAETMK